MSLPRRGGVPLFAAVSAQRGTPRRRRQITGLPLTRWYQGPRATVVASQSREDVRIPVTYHERSLPEIRGADIVRPSSGGQVLINPELDQSGQRNRVEPLALATAALAAIACCSGALRFTSLPRLVRTWTAPAVWPRRAVDAAARPTCTTARRAGRSSCAPAIAAATRRATR